MAKVLFTAVVAEMRGKIAGTVFSKNRSGAFTRTKTSPINRRTVAQSESRGNLALLVSMWRDLPQLTQEAWINAAQMFPRTDVYGNQKILTGQNLFISCNLNLLTAGLPTTTTAPSPGVFPTFNAVSLITDATSTIVTGLEALMSGSIVPAGYTVIVYATPPQSWGRNSFSDYRWIHTENSGTSLDSDRIDLTFSYSLKFGTTPVGRKIGVSVRLVENATGLVRTAQNLVAYYPAP